MSPLPDDPRPVTLPIRDGTRRLPILGRREAQRSPTSAAGEERPSCRLAQGVGRRGAAPEDSKPGEEGVSPHRPYSTGAEPALLLPPQ